MKNNMIFAAMATAVTIMVCIADAKEPDKHYSWNGYELTYPEGWKIVKESDIPDSGRIIALVHNKESLEVVVGLLDKLSAADARKEKTTPATLAMTFGVPIALKLANKNESAISISYGSMGLYDQRVLSTRFTVALPNIPDVYNIECFSTTTGSRLFVGAIQSSSKKGHLPEDNASYRKAFQEAYHIAKSITAEKMKN